MPERISVARVRQVLAYFPDIGHFRWRISPCNSVFIGDLAGTKKNGYIWIRIDTKVFAAHILAWVLMKGDWPAELIDHEDKDRANNRWTNLRPATYQQNQFNRGASKRNKYGQKGVSKHKGRYRAQIREGGTIRHIGLFATPEEAGAAYRAEAKRLHGVFYHAGA